MELIYEIENQIVEELREELIKEENGFFCNWNVIEDSIRGGQAVCFVHRNKVVGFCTWSDHHEYITIELFEILEKWRGKHLGIQSFELIEEYFKIKNKWAFKLNCAPRESYSFWKRCGFIDFPKEMFFLPELSMWKPIIDQPNSNRFDDNDRIELWNVDPSFSQEGSPVWAWSVEEINSGLKLIHPAYYDWNIRWIRNGLVLGESRLKKITKINDEFVKSPFLIIKSITENQLREKQP